MALEQTIQKRADYWASAAIFDANTRKEIQDLLTGNNVKELTDRFYRDLEFGTGGLRGILGAGTSRMNIYNIRKATTALARYLKTQVKDKIQVAISHDSRQFSREFAQATAEVLAAHGITALITKELRPVPMLSYMVRHFNCQAGVCVTASHNPPDYNGYKVYWGSGGQLVPPHDKAIIQCYGDIASYEELTFMPYAEGKAKGLIKEIGVELDDPYFAKVKSLSLSSAGRSGFKIVYSPLHGSGLYPVTEMLKQFGFADVLVVPEQRDPNGKFPTVSSPNPENPTAMNLARELGKKVGADIILATDPDCDRIGMEVLVNGQYFRPNGNQIGALLTDYVLQEKARLKSLPKLPLVIKTVVTSDLQADLAAEFGAHCEETLTGFKWICDVIEGYEQGRLTPKREFVCGGEESYGFLADSFVRDKDAVIACALAAEMVAVYKSQNKTVIDALDRMFTKHGAYYETLADLTLPGKDGADRIKAMMQRLRTTPPKVIDGIPVKILRDFETRQIFEIKNGELIQGGAITLPRSDVLQFILDDGTKVSVRPSGTEPKIKFYVSVRDPSAKGATGSTLKAIKDKCQSRAKKIEEIFVAMANS